MYYIDIDEMYDAFHMAAQICGTVTNPVKVRCNARNACNAYYWQHVLHVCAACSVQQPGTDPSSQGDVCDHNGISEPDNVAFLPGQDMLLIGEDTNERQIDTLWQLQISTGAQCADVLGVIPS